MRRVFYPAVLTLLLAVSGCTVPGLSGEDIAFNMDVYLVDSWDTLKAAVEDPSGPDLIAVAGQIKTPAAAISGFISVSRTVTVTGYKDTGTIIRQANFETHFFNVNAGGNLVLGHPRGGTLVMDGNTAVPLVSATHFVHIVGNGSCTMKDGVILQGNNGHGAVEVDGGRFYMEGGIIRNNSTATGFAGGIWVGFAGAFTMTGGTITGNASTGGGGVAVENTSSFTMYGGTISGNTSSGGGGVSVDNAVFVMNGGTINGNTVSISQGGGGIRIFNNGSFTLNGGTISGNDTPGGGGGIASTGGGTINLAGGTISGNRARGQGGGVYFTGSGGSFTMSGSVRISGNSTESSISLQGGGIHLDASSSTVNITGGIIENNKVKSTSGTGTARGGGMYLSCSTSVILSGLTIRGNTAQSASSGAQGGGLYLTPNSSATITWQNGDISGNTATGTSSNGGGIYVDTSSGIFKKTGGTVYGNEPPPLGNVANAGKAVYAGSSSLKKESTSGQGNMLDSGTAGPPGGWDP